jgi:hypothetical protein
MAADQPVAALVVLEDDEVLAHEPHRLDRPVAGKLVDQGGRLPVAPHQASAGRGAGSGAGDEIVLFRAQHQCGDSHVHFVMNECFGDSRAVGISFSFRFKLRAHAELGKVLHQQRCRRAAIDEPNGLGIFQEALKIRNTHRFRRVTAGRHADCIRRCGQHHLG